MIQLRFDQLAEYCHGRLVNSSHGAELFYGVSIDSRTLKEQELFIAINGEQQDGHQYISQAVNKGAKGIIAENSYANLLSISKKVPVVTVENSHVAMLDLAKTYRNSLHAKFIGITGSNGKTTTKELAFSLLQAVEQNVYKTPGNLNNLFGVPLTLFKIDKECKAAVLELGISTENEMPKLAEIAQPNVVVITNVGISHLEFLSSVQEVAQAKLELIKNLPSDVPLIINADDAVLMEEAKKIRDYFITFSLENNADFKVEKITPHADSGNIITIDSHDFYLPLIGKHQIANLTAAYAAVKTLGYSFDNIDTMQIKFETAPMRGQVLEISNMKIISDCYNANPDSMKAGLKAFFELQTENRRVLILGDMLELGNDAEKYHRQLGEFLSDKDFDMLITAGELTKEIQKNCIADGIKKVEYANSKELSDEILSYIEDGDFIYIKGSRGVGLEKVLQKLQTFGEET